MNEVITKKKYAAYIQPKIEIIKVETEGVIAFSSFIDPDGQIDPGTQSIDRDTYRNFEDKVNDLFK